MDNALDTDKANTVEDTTLCLYLSLCSILVAGPHWGVAPTSSLPVAPAPGPTVPYLKHSLSVSSQQPQ